MASGLKARYSAFTSGGTVAAPVPWGVPVPPDEMQAFKLFNPTATEAEITAWYNKHKK